MSTGRKRSAPKSMAGLWDQDDAVAEADLQATTDTSASTVGDGFLLDFITDEKSLKDSPEEGVPQRLARASFHEYGISVEDMEGDYVVRVLSSGATLVLFAILWLLGGPSTLALDLVTGDGQLAVILPVLVLGGVLLLLASWTLSLHAAAQARHWLWAAFLLGAGLLNFSMILLPLVMPQLWQCLFDQNSSVPAGLLCPPVNPLVPTLTVVGYFVSPAAALVYAARPWLLAQRTHRLPEGLTVSRLGTTVDLPIEPDLPSQDPRVGDSI